MQPLPRLDAPGQALCPAPCAQIGWGHIDARIVPSLVAAAQGPAPVLEGAKAEAALCVGAMHELRRAYWNDASVLAGAAVGAGADADAAST